MIVSLSSALRGGPLPLGGILPLFTISKMRFLSPAGFGTFRLVKILNSFIAPSPVWQRAQRCNRISVTSAPKLTVCWGAGVCAFGAGGGSVLVGGGVGGSAF